MADRSRDKDLVVLSNRTDVISLVHKVNWEEKEHKEETGGLKSLGHTCRPAAAVLLETRAGWEKSQRG